MNWIEHKIPGLLSNAQVKEIKDKSSASLSHFILLIHKPSEAFQSPYKFLFLKKVIVLGITDVDLNWQPLLIKVQLQVLTYLFLLNYTIGEFLMGLIISMIKFDVIKIKFYLFLSIMNI